MISAKIVLKALRNRRNDIIVCLFLGITTFSIYWKIHQYDFMHIDDNEYVYENPHVRNGITAKNIIWSVTAFHSNNWHPLTWMSHMLDCQLFGLRPGYHHLTNLLFHFASTLLLFFIFRQMTGNLWKSGFIAALFALHPLHVESVAWIAERKDVLSAFFWMLTMWSYIWYLKRPTIMKYSAIIIFFVFGLMSKPMVVTLPFVLLLIDYWPLHRFEAQPLSINKNCGTTIHLVLEKIPLLVLAAISCFLTYFAQRHGGIVKSLEVFPLGVRIANAIVAYASYVGKMIYPTGMAVLYPHHGLPPWWKIICASIVLTAISLLSIRDIKKRPYLIVGWLWYLGTLVPVIGIVQVGMQSMADRYAYIPSVGLFILAAWGFPDLVTQWRCKKILFFTAGSMLIVIFSTITWNQIKYWKNSLTMLEHTLKVTSENYLALDAMGVEVFRQGRVQEAISYYFQAERIYPKNPYTHFNLGVAFFQQGRVEEAIQEYCQAIGIEPNYFKAYNNLGAAFYVQGNIEKAIEQYRKASELKPDYPDAHVNWAIALDKQGHIEDAIRQYKEALLADPNNINALFNFGDDLGKMGHLDDAIQQYLKALHLNPASVQINYALGLAFYKGGKIEEAIKYDLAALKIKPDSAEIYNNLGSAYYKQGKIKEAARQFLQALRFKPDYAEAHNNLGGALFLEGDLKGAISSFQEALRISPDYVSAKHNLQKVLLALEQQNQGPSTAQ